ncbi:MAG: Co2+/Mg2+ efflux protein ApaG [Bradymonadia bacterium]|jgi:ApaG protein
MSEATTRGIRIRVRSQFVPERSSPEESYYFFAYHVVITNEGDEAARLVARHWIITDGTGLVQEVKGPGVVGEQPVLAPGQRFEYTSACPLKTPVGTMHGAYDMVTATGDAFEARIAPFTLAFPYAIH